MYEFCLVAPGKKKPDGFRLGLRIPPQTGGGTAIGGLGEDKPTVSVADFQATPTTSAGNERILVAPITGVLQTLKITLQVFFNRIRLSIGVGWHGEERVIRNSSVSWIFDHRTN